MMRRVAAAALSAIVLIAVLAGLPTLLLAVGGNPLPDQVPDLDQLRRAFTAPDDRRVMLAAALLSGWVCWGLLLGAALAEVVDQVRVLRRPDRAPARDAASRTGLGMPRSLMRPLVASVLAVLVSTPAGGALTAGPAVAHTAAGPAVPGTQEQPEPAPARPQASTPVQGEPGHETAGPATHTVQPGDTLWEIAENHLGAGERYPEVHAENSDHLTSPHLIYPGTVLPLPGSPPTLQELEAIDVVVAAGDTLSGVAADHLGDADRWPEIYAASADITQNSGARLADPDLIQPGWHLQVPTSVTKKVQEETAQPHLDSEPAPSERTADSTVASPTRGAAAGRHLGVVATSGEIPANTTTSTATAPSVPASQGRQDALEEEEDPALLPSEAGWLVAGLAGAGGTLAGALWLGLRQRRRAQSRHRRPGMDVGAPVPPELAPLEQTTQTVGPVAAVSIEILDRVMKHLVAPAADRAVQSVPALVAARLSNREGIDLFFADPQELHHPWEQVGGDGTRWRLARPSPGPALQIDAPYPLLATVGTDDTEGTWLFNLEGLHVAITGDPTMAHDLTRHIAAGALLHPWSQDVQLDCLGIAQELQPVDPTRVSTHGLQDDLEDVRQHLAQTTARAGHHQVDATTGRVHGTGDDAWPIRLIITDTGTEHAQDIAGIISADPSRVSAAIVMTQPGQGTAGAPSLVLDVTAQGRIQVGDVGLDLVAVGLTADEATGIGMLCAAADDHRETPVPSHHVDDPQDVRHYIDRSGGLLEAHRSELQPVQQEPQTHPTEIASTRPQRVDAADSGAISVLHAPAQDYLAAAATTEADLRQIAPHVSEQTRASISDVDPTLDEDLAAWNDPDSKRARLRLLGPVKAHTFGTAQSHSKGYLTEVLAYLALRPDGATPDQLADAFGLTRKKARDYVSTVRAWLGQDPATGQLHLPYADDVIRHDGVKLYRLSGVLVDADLFKRLHARGVSRGPEGFEDLLAALRLVTGQPFDRLRPQGWGWLFESAERVDQYLVVGIGTLAHLVTVHSLQTGDLAQARWATQVAQKADPYAETPNLDLAAIAIAEGRHQDGANLLRAHVTGRTDDHRPPPELSSRTEEILGQRPEWLAGRDAAAS